MDRGFQNGTAPSSMWSYTCDSCHAVHGSATGDGPCPHQQPVVSNQLQDDYPYNGTTQSGDMGSQLRTGLSTSAGIGAEWVVHTGSFDQQQDRNYQPNIVFYDLISRDETSQPQGWQQNALTDNAHFNAGANMTTPQQQDYSNGNHDTGYPHGINGDSPYHANRTSWTAGSSSGHTVPQTHSTTTNTNDYCYSEDDRVVSDQPMNRSSLQPFTIRHLKRVRQVIRDADAMLENRQSRHYYSS